MPSLPRTLPKGTPYEHLPSFEVLQQRSGLKVAKLRQVLKDVTKYKCPDNTVRYDDTAATAALEAAGEPYADELEDAAAAAVSEPTPTDPVQAALQVMNRAMSLLTVVVRERGDIVKICCDVIKTMGEPQKLGQQMAQENVSILQKEVESYRGQHLDLLRLVTELHDTKDDRERQARADAERSKFRHETFDMAKRYVPRAIDKFELTAEAGLAVELLRGLDPDALGPIVEHALPSELHAKAGKLISILRARRAAARAHASSEQPEEKGGDNGSGQAHTESTPSL